MAKLNVSRVAGLVLMLMGVRTITAQGQVFTSLASFDGINGAVPAQVVQGTDGNLYGTSGGGANNAGTVFRVGLQGTLTTLHSFCSETNCTDGDLPTEALVLASDGDLYGTTYQGGLNNMGTVFRITQGGTLTAIYSFCSQFGCTDGAHPTAGLIQATNGNFYGTTSAGGGYGTVFKITPTGKLTTLHSFSPPEGEEPTGLIQATDGNFFGTAPRGGINDAGTVFKITPGGNLTTLYRFCGQFNCTDGANPLNRLVQAADGSFYGTTYAAGDLTCNEGFGCGTVFKITAGGRLTTIHRFEATDGVQPMAGLVQATDGNLYGTTLGGGDLGCNPPNGCGTIFNVAPGPMLTTLHRFESTDGRFLFGSLVQATDGSFYGATGNGGGPYDDGTIFSLDVGLGPFVTFVRAAGKVGQTGAVLGQGFTGTTSVSLNGVAANFKVVSDTLIRATVPAGATTGYVTVTTPSGTLTSNAPFHVIP